MLRADEPHIIAVLLAGMTPTTGTLAELAFATLLAIVRALIIRRDTTAGMALRHLAVAERPVEIAHIIIATPGTAIETVLAVLVTPGVLGALMAMMLGVAVILRHGEIDGCRLSEPVERFAGVVGMMPVRGIALTLGTALVVAVLVVAAIFVIAVMTALAFAAVLLLAVLTALAVFVAEIDLTQIPALDNRCDLAYQL